MNDGNERVRGLAEPGHPRKPVNEIRYAIEQ